MRAVMTDRKDPLPSLGHIMSNVVRGRDRAAIVAVVVASLVLVCFVWSPGASIAAQTTPPSLEGKWTGTLGGPRGLHVELIVATLGDGSFGGHLNSVDQGSVLQLAAVHFASGKVHFEVPDVGGVYDGTINDAGTDITGTWQQTGGPKQPLNFKRAADAAPRAAAPATESAEPPFSAPFDVRIPKPPQAFAADGKTHLAYELHVGNYDDPDCTLIKLEVLAAGSEKTLAAYSASDLEGMTVQVGPDSIPHTKLPGGTVSVIYVWLTLDSAADVPDALRHRFTMKIAGYKNEVTVETLPSEVNRKPVPVIAPPLRGDNWLAVNGPSNTSAHRRSLLTVDGGAWIAQRYAIDWVRMYPNQETHQGDATNNKSYRAYGSEALAVAGGVVTETKDGIPENVPGPKSRAVPITLETIGGNHVILDLGNGTFACYAHLQPGSLRVHTGDRVNTGDVLGLVGNSGNSTEPHLHFDLCDRSSMLACEGVPYALASYDELGSGTSQPTFKLHDVPLPKRLELPLEFHLVRFPGIAR
jgi:murein DD-endopeptidase